MLLTPHPTWSVTDSSKLEEFETCPRKYFFRYRYGWTPDRPSLDLVHGEAWHEGKRQLYLAKGKTGSYNDGFEAAIAEYLKCYAKYYGEEEWSWNSPKNPDGARLGFSTFIEENDEDVFKLIGAEIHGTVPVSEKYVLVAKLDTLIETNEGIMVIDHKTSKNSLSEIFIDEYQMKLQFNTYSLMGLVYCLSMGYKPGDFQGVLINHAAFKESKKLGKTVECTRFSIKKTVDQLEQYMQEAEQLIELIEWNDATLRKDRDDELVMLAFPRRTQSCTKYFRRCEYYDMCRYFTNPLRFLDKPQAGFHVEWWDPRKVEGRQREFLKFKGLKKEGTNASVRGDQPRQEDRVDEDSKEVVESTLAVSRLRVRSRSGYQDIRQLGRRHGRRLGCPRAPRRRRIFTGGVSGLRHGRRK